MPIARDIPGATAFIVGGGPSAALQDLGLLRGHPVVEINRSFELVPWADVLFFADSRCWRWYKDGFESFAGRVVTVYERTPLPIYPARFEQYKKARPPLLSRDPNALTLARTSMTGAINYLTLRGATRIVILGLDGKAATGPDGKLRTHHHAPHPRPPAPGGWDKHGRELRGILPCLRDLGVEVVNASPGSACDAFPVLPLAEALGRPLACAA